MDNKAGNFGLGIFIVSALLILATGVFLIGDKEFMFSSTYRLKADFQNVAGLNKGSDVRVGGLREGTVQELELPGPPDRKVTVVMRMRKPTMAILRKDSVASIRTEGILGDKYVDITLGSQGAAAVANDDAIHGEATVDVAEVANSVAMQAKSALGSLQENMEALRQSFLFRGYFNKRGYEDSGDLTRHAIARLPSRTPAKEFAYRADDLFGKPDGVKLKNPKTLDEAGQYLEKNAFGAVVVAVHAGAVGDSDQQRTLTQTQSMIVRDYLVQGFAIDDTRIKTSGLGKTRVPGETGQVRVLVYSQGAAVKTSQKPATTSPPKQKP